MGALDDDSSLPSGESDQPIITPPLPTSPIGRGWELVETPLDPFDPIFLIEPHRPGAGGRRLATLGDDTLNVGVLGMMCLLIAGCFACTKRCNNNFPARGA